MSINGTDAENVKYEWVELSKEERASLGLTNGSYRSRWQQMAAARGRASGVDAGDPRGDGNENPGSEEAARWVDPFDQRFKHPFGNLKVGNHPVLHGPNGVDLARGLP